MIKYLDKFFYIINIRKKQLIIIFFTVSSASVLESLGIRLIYPLVSLISQENSLKKIPWLNWLSKTLGITNQNYLIAVCAILFTIIFIFNSSLYLISQNFINSFYNHQKTRLVRRLVKGYLQLPYTFYFEKNSADIVKNIIIEVNGFCQQCISPLLNGSTSLITIIVLGILLAKTNLFLFTLILVAIFPMFIFCSYLWQKMRKWGKIQSQAQREIILTINHILGSLKETQIIGCQEYFKEKLVEPTQSLEQAMTLSQTYQIFPKFLLEVFLLLSVIIFICFSVIFNNQNIVELYSTLGVFALAFLRISPAISSFISAINYLQTSHYALETLYADLYQIDQFKNQNFTNIALDSEIIPFDNEVKIEQINYRYKKNSRLILENLSLTIKPGELIAIVGKSGSGKTTLVDIILGILTPEIGDIKVDGISIYQNLRAWQNIIGYVPQTIFLIDDTIEKNIAFGVEDESINIERVNEVIKMAQLTDLIEQLPQGIKTLVGERGILLSGGQRQRIGIARVLYHNRKILVFDEATSALDQETEKNVNEAIQSLMGKVTMIIVAHRLTTITHCDRIYFLDADSKKLTETNFLSLQNIEG
ncbi:ATP-binding cassette domain-containing protein [Geminocystis sp. GBBB08]|uniref:ABC transporter ATP-binding protein n=1 Tax=Geminocystis sp. GBBB08 TaxID=2604140 RepID=UPI0027E267C9|nr:ATP-binding cassette domain-containing protein [Geminocystis sp. GBBB08]MBL1209300.1 ATP-binding cassette domain-containing protein [Geminocystis sp. GBBB08]